MYDFETAASFWPCVTLDSIPAEVSKWSGGGASSPRSSHNDNLLTVFVKFSYLTKNHKY